MYEFQHRKLILTFLNETYVRKSPHPDIQRLLPSYQNTVYIHNPRDEHRRYAILGE
jgi:hypothetical protein